MKQCPQFRQGKPLESKGQMVKSPSNKTTSNYVTSQEYEKETELQQTQQRIEQLRRELQDAELQEAVALRTVVMHVVKPNNESKDPALGKFQTPSIAVNNYGGGMVSIINQIPVSLKLGNKEGCATILVQRELHWTFYWVLTC